MFHPVAEVTTQPLPLHRHFPQALHPSLGVLQTEPYLPNLVQAYVNLLRPTPKAIVIVGGDGQDLTQSFLQILFKILAGNGVGQIMTGCNGLLTPALVSHLITTHGALGGIFLSGSGEGPLNFQLRFFWRDGRELQGDLATALQERTQILRTYYHLDAPPLPLHRPQTLALGSTQITVMEGPRYYLSWLAQGFDLEAITQCAFGIADGLKSPITVACGDHYVWGMAQFILETALGFPAGTVIFHDSPALPTAGDVYQLWGDRCLWPGVSGGDALALLVAHRAVSPYYRSQFQGVVRSRWLSGAVDHVCAYHQYPWEERDDPWDSLGPAGELLWVGDGHGALGLTASPEPDGLWVLVFALAIVAQQQQSWGQLLQNHWQKFGRHYWAYEPWPALTPDQVRALLATLGQRDLRGHQWGPWQVAYEQVTQGLGEGRVWGFTDGSRLGVHCRGQEVWVLRERYGVSSYGQSVATMLDPLGALINHLGGL